MGIARSGPENRRIHARSGMAWNDCNRRVVGLPGPPRCRAKAPFAILIIDGSGSDLDDSPLNGFLVNYIEPILLRAGPRTLPSIPHRGQGAEYEQCRNHPSSRASELCEWRLAASRHNRIP